jgi:hypothetical protein
MTVLILDQNFVCYGFNSQLARPWESSSDSNNNNYMDNNELPLVQGQRSVRFRRKQGKKVKSQQQRKQQQSSSSSTSTTLTAQTLDQSLEDIVIVGLDDYIARDDMVNNKEYNIDVYDDIGDEKDGDILIVGIDEVSNDDGRFVVHYDHPHNGSDLSSIQEYESTNSDGTKNNLYMEVDNITSAMASIVENLSSSTSSCIPSPRIAYHATKQASLAASSSSVTIGSTGSVSFRNTEILHPPPPAISKLAFQPTSL